MPLKVLVAGAGLGGLAAGLALRLDGHEVIILESTREFGEVSIAPPPQNQFSYGYAPVTPAEITRDGQIGAGIHLPPNSTRLLERWGVNVSAIGFEIDSFSYRQGEDDYQIKECVFGDCVENFGAKYYMVHRADLHKALLDRARQVGVVVRGGKRVVQCNTEIPQVTTQDGETFKGDLVVGADGIRSAMRSIITGDASIKPRDSGDVAYRFLVPATDLASSPDLQSLSDEKCMNAWVAQGAHVIGYPIRNGQLYNVVCCVTTNSTGASIVNEQYVVPGDPLELYGYFVNVNWNNRVRQLCGLAKDIKKWRLCDLDRLPTWVSPSGKACLLGDSCHAMLPYLAQGAAQAFEDVGTLRACLSKSGADVPKALHWYEAIRRPRTADLSDQVRAHRDVWHEADPLAQFMRNNIAQTEDGEENPLFWGCESRVRWLFGHDAEVLGETGENWLSKVDQDSMDSSIESSNHFADSSWHV